MTLDALKWREYHAANCEDISLLFTFPQNMAFRRMSAGCSSARTGIAVKGIEDPRVRMQTSDRRGSGCVATDSQESWIIRVDADSSQQRTSTSPRDVASQSQSLDHVSHVVNKCRGTNNKGIMLSQKLGLFAFGQATNGMDCL
jgi:hypothetical protein